MVRHSRINRPLQWGIIAPPFSLKRSLRGEFGESVWPHPSGTVSAPFQAGEHSQIAVKVVDDRGNELMVVKSLSEAEA